MPRIRGDKYRFGCTSLLINWSPWVNMPAKRRTRWEQGSYKRGEPDLVSLGSENELNAESDQDGGSKSDKEGVPAQKVELTKSSPNPDPNPNLDIPKCHDSEAR